MQCRVKLRGAYCYLLLLLLEVKIYYCYYSHHHHHHHHHQKALRNKSHTSHGHRPGLRPMTCQLAPLWKRGDLGTLTTAWLNSWLLLTGCPPSNHLVAPWCLVPGREGYGSYNRPGLRRWQRRMGLACLAARRNTWAVAVAIVAVTHMLRP